MAAELLLATGSFGPYLPGQWHRPGAFTGLMGLAAG